MHKTSTSPGLWPLLAAAVAALLSACTSTPPSRQLPAPQRDGPPLTVPPDLERVPNAVPRLEPLRKGGPNKPYEVLGQQYQPMTEDLPLTERGLASWYGRQFHGRPTASGEVYNMYAMTAAHPTMPIPSYARVRNPANGREVIVRINDRGPFHRGRIIDLSYTAALKLDVLRGVAPVELERITYEDIRSGAWLRGAEPPEPDAPPVYAAQTPAGGAQSPSTVQQREAAGDTTPVGEMRVAGPSGYWLQLGAFARLEGAEAQRRELLQTQQELRPMLTIFRERKLHRLQLGPFETQEQAQQAAQQLRRHTEVKPVLVQRR
ncbi:septal ring lytic transglycosylase RlpA family protein [Roseateles sp. BYS180W]|uniref:Endolytic peptidoglycan transglycosylase RlpA n=1 Tax=Roseateles rivi TaxID=3299028 RepID=A0ABW7FTN5_9BURK